MLRTLQRMDVPCVDPSPSSRTASTSTVSRCTRARHPAPAVLAAVPRAVLADAAAETATRLVDALALLLVRLHVIGFYCGDVSLSNTLFRRDAEPSPRTWSTPRREALPGGLSNGQRENDLEVARVNIAGELLDLEAGGRLDENADAVDVSNRIVAQYRTLWKELTAPSSSTSRSGGASTTASNASTRSASTSRSSRSTRPRAGRRCASSRRSSTAGHHQRRLRA